MIDTLQQTAAPVVFIPLALLEATIDSIFTRRIQEKQQQDLQAQYLSPEETCKLFNPKISKVTLNEWTNKGYLTKYYLGGRTFYKYGEVIEAAKSLKKYSRQIA